MAKTALESVDRYIASQPKPVQRVLARVRKTIRKAMPGTEEMISYGMPTFKLRGRPVLSFAGWNQHYALYGSTDRLLSEFEEELARYDVSKGTIRFPFAEPVPVTLIEGIAKFRAKEAAERERAKAPQKRR
jgi:uncharacterized protein YdhG (YjbR/CyaY superfamily)